MSKESYAKGFCKVAEHHGVDPSALADYIAKSAQDATTNTADTATGTSTNGFWNRVLQALSSRSGSSTNGVSRSGSSTNGFSRSGSSTNGWSFVPGSLSSQSNILNRLRSRSGGTNTTNKVQK